MILKNGYKLVLAGVGALFMLPINADASDNSGDVINFDLRYRYEFVDQDGFAENANASTLRGRLRYLSSDWDGLRAFVELASVQPLFVDDYNSGAGTSSPWRNRYPVVADQDYAEVNQAYLQYSAPHDTQLRVGRQIIFLDNKRFIGDVGWRQNDQTYDAVSISHAPTDQTALYYAFISDVNRIFGNNVAAGRHKTSTHLLNAGYDFSDAGRLSGYYYSIDNDDAPAFSTRTTGLRFAGKTQLNGKALRYLAEYASQDAATNNPVDYSADYFRLDATLDFGDVDASAGYESLSGEQMQNGAAFRTPLATLHAFNGWGDQFLSTPDKGLVDRWLGLSGKIDTWSWQALYHQYASEKGSVDYGDELDLLATRKFGKDYGLLFKAALFNGDTGFADVTKLWVMLTANF